MRASRAIALAISTIWRCATLIASMRAAGIDLEAKPIEDLPGLGSGARPIDPAPARFRQPAEVDVLRHGQVRGLSEFLIDHGDAELQHALRASASSTAAPSITTSPSLA